MEENVLNLFKEGVVAISEGIQNLAPHVWEIMVKQQVVEGYTSFLWVVVLIVLAIVGFVVVKNLGKTVKKECHGDEWCVYIIGGIVILGLLLCGIGNIVEGIRHLFNPEYYALMDLKQIVLP